MSGTDSTPWVCGLCGMDLAPAPADAAAAWEAFRLHVKTFHRRWVHKVAAKHGGKLVRQY